MTVPPKQTYTNGFIQSSYQNVGTPEHKQFLKEYSQSLLGANQLYVQGNYYGSPTGASSYSRDFRNLDGNTSARTGFTREDYEYFRPLEALPRNPKDTIRLCMNAYNNIGLIKNVIDLMGDFGSQGIRITHPNKFAETFGKKWFKICHGDSVSERFLNLFYRTGIVITHRTFGRFTNKTKQDMKTMSASEVIRTLPTNLRANEIPMKYTFINPLSVEVIGEDLAPMTGEFRYAVVIPTALRNRIRRIMKAGKKLTAIEQVEKELIETLPTDMVNAILEGAKMIPLSMNEVQVHYYKKDDWQVWPTPMIAGILKDLYVLEKMKLSDLAALDSIISTIRLWKLGDLDKQIIPTQDMFDRLASILLNNTGGGSYDLIWTPELEFQESKSEVYKSLGKAKYEPTLNAIYDGLGIPVALISSASSSSYNNAAISMKTLIERLQYGRNMLIDFWEKELAILQKAMGFAKPFKVEFSRTTLEDEASRRQILLGMWDRDMIANEDVLLDLGIDPDMAEVRVKRDMKRREGNKIPHKASPFHTAQTEHALEKIFAQAKVVTPSELGLELKPRKEGEKTGAEMQMEMAKQKMAQAGPKGEPGQGRPAGKKDSQPRKPRTVKPRTSISSEFASVNIWAKEAQRQISDILTPGLLNKFGKKNLRMLTAEENKMAEEFKFAVLLAFEPFEPVTVDTVYNKLESGNNIAISTDARELVDGIFASCVANNTGRDMTLDDYRNIQTHVYTILNTEFNDEQG